MEMGRVANRLGQSLEDIHLIIFLPGERERGAEKKKNTHELISQSFLSFFILLATRFVQLDVEVF